MRRCLSYGIGLALVVCVSPAVSAQSRYAAPKTPWSEPDLQAIWEGDTLVIETTSFNGRATTPPKTYTRPYTISIPYTSPAGYLAL
jgi:hypothetical protein